MTPQLTILSLGWGVQSWTLAAMAALGELPPVDYAIHADTTWEREQTYSFAETWTPWLEAHGVKIVTVTDPEQAAAVTTMKTDIPAFTAGQNGATVIDGQLRRQCTGRWKVDPQNAQMRAELERRGLRKTPGVIEKWLGISKDEWQRAKHADVKYIAHRYPLLEKGMTRADCIAWLQAHDLPVPPKSACVFCPFHNKAAWQEMKRAGGRDWQVALEIDTQIRTARPPYPLFVHRARVPLAEAVQIPEDYGMQQADLFGPVEDDDAATCDSGHCFL